MKCAAVLKTGPRKGAACGIKDCKRHKVIDPPAFPTLTFIGSDLAKGIVASTATHQLVLEGDRLFLKAGEDSEEVLSGAELVPSLVSELTCTDCGSILKHNQHCKCGGSFDYELSIAQRYSVV